MLTPEMEARELKILRRMVKAQDKLLVAYRLGTSRTPAGALDELEACRKALAKLAAEAQPGEEQ